MYYRPGPPEDCQQCGEGHFLQLSGHQRTECDKCPAGRFAPNAGRDNCDVCSAGSFSYEGANSCTNCEPGYYCPGDSFKIECPVGSVSGQGASICQKCTPGSFAADTGSTICEECSSGSYSEEGDSSCKTCSPNYYCPGGSNQIPCVQGMTSEEEATRCHYAGKLPQTYFLLLTAKQ